MFDRLVSRAVLAEADRVMGPDVDNGQLHQRYQPYRRPHVVAEDQECAAVGPQATVQVDAVHDRAHGMFPDPEMQDSAVRVPWEHPGLPVAGQEALLTFWCGVVGFGQISR